MSYLALALAVFCAYLIWQLHRAQAELAEQRESEGLDRIELLRRFHYERQGLLNRIQAPELGVAQSMAEEADGLVHHAAADGSPYEDEQWEAFIEDGLRQRGVEVDG